MMPSDLSNHISKWFSGTGPCSDVVISSRVRLARNIHGYNFLSCIEPQDQQKVLDILKDAILTLDLGEHVSFIDIKNSPKLDKDLLIERHLISKRHSLGKGPRGVVIADSENFTAMINEEDHLRMQVIMAGFQLKQCWQQIDKFDDMISKKVRFCFSQKYGYLTACPTNVGTGIRVSVMLHLPGLKMTGQIEKFLAAAQDMHLAVRGLFGEGTEAVGDFFQLSNQVTLGESEQTIVDKFSNDIVPKIIEYEKLARQELIHSKNIVLDDKIQRALGVLKNARMMSSHEALFLLSNVRLGVNLKRVNDIPISTINELFMLSQPAHLQINRGCPLAPEDRDAIRADIIRSKFRSN